jgi:UDP-N-acetylmuramate dehydrogenase
MDIHSFESKIPLKYKTSFHIGGCAEFYSDVHSEKEIISTIKWASRRSIPVFIMGKGSNVLISDSGWQGIVINMSHFDSVCWDNTIAKCQSGALLHGLVKQSVDHGFSGMEKLAGIPGSIGGGLIMNAGAFSQNISDTVDSITVFDIKSLRKRSLKHSDVEFSYRNSSLKNNKSVVLDATFCFKMTSKEDVRKIYYDILKKRKEKQPLDFPNCGSVFKRPLKGYAGELIEKSGLKGFRIGGAMISPKHANFIINTGNATAGDVRELIAYSQEKVFRNYNILLEPEVIFIGNFNIPLFKP